MDGFGDRLRQLRVERRLTMKDVAARIGVSLSTYREWEYGRRILGEPYLRIASALDIGVGELLSGERPDKQKLMAEISEIEGHLAKLKTKLQSYL